MHESPARATRARCWSKHAPHANKHGITAEWIAATFLCFSIRWFHPGNYRHTRRLESVAGLNKCCRGRPLRHRCCSNFKMARGAWRGSSESFSPEETNTLFAEVVLIHNRWTHSFLHLGGEEIVDQAVIHGAIFFFFSFPEQEMSRWLYKKSKKIEPGSIRPGVEGKRFRGYDFLCTPHSALHVARHQSFAYGATMLSECLQAPVGEKLPFE